MTSGQIQTYSVKYLGGDDTITLTKGNVYTACDIHGVTKLIGIINDQREEYAYPAKWFERVDAPPTPLKHAK